jgi:hypothetical protein
VYTAVRLQYLCRRSSGRPWGQCRSTSRMQKWHWLVVVQLWPCRPYQWPIWVQFKCSNHLLALRWLEWSRPRMEFELRLHWLKRKQRIETYPFFFVWPKNHYAAKHEYYITWMFLSTISISRKNKTTSIKIWMHCLFLTHTWFSLSIFVVVVVAF